MAQWLPQSWRQALTRLRDDIHRALDRWLPRRRADQREKEAERWLPARWSASVEQLGTDIHKVLDSWWPRWRGREVDEEMWSPSLVSGGGPRIDLEETDDEVIVLAAAPGFNDHPEDLEKFYICPPGGGKVPLSAVAKFREVLVAKGKLSVGTLTGPSVNCGIATASPCTCAIDASPTPTAGTPTAVPLTEVSIRPARLKPAAGSVMLWATTVSAAALDTCRFDKGLAVAVMFWAANDGRCS